MNDQVFFTIAIKASNMKAVVTVPLIPPALNWAGGNGMIATAKEQIGQS